MKKSATKYIIHYIITWCNTFLKDYLGIIKLGKTSIELKFDIVKFCQVTKYTIEGNLTNLTTYFPILNGQVTV